MRKILYVFMVFDQFQVKINDIVLAKRYGIRTFPALMYFRNGNPLLFDGKADNLRHFFPVSHTIIITIIAIIIIIAFLESYSLLLTGVDAIENLNRTKWETTMTSLF